MAVVSTAIVDRVLSRRQPQLNADQAAAVRALTSSGSGVDVIEALAGTGKTTMIGVLADCYRTAGWQVIGAAPTGRAARQLREVARIPAGTMHALVGELDWSRTLGTRTVLVLDEAGMAPTRLTARLFAHAERGGVKVIAVGDPGQLGSVEPGGWLAALARHQPAPQLREVMRQLDPKERDALESLREGEPARYLAHKQDAIAVHATEIDALATLTNQWHIAKCEHGDASAVMIARDNGTRDRLNRAARAQLKRDGGLSMEGIVLGGREFAEGDRVIARRNDRQLDVDNGTLGTVIGVSARDGVRIRTASDRVHQLDPVYAAAHLEHAYAITGHSAQSSTVSWAGVIGRPEEFTREWAYTALSRAREQTLVYVISERSELEHERDDYGPAASARDRNETLRALSRSMKRSETELLAIEQARQDNPHRWLTDADAAQQRQLERIPELDVHGSLARTPPPPFRGPPSRWSAHRGDERARGIAR